MPSNHKAILERIDKVYPSKSTRPGYQGKPVYKIVGKDCDDGREIVLQIAEPADNFKSWQPTIQALRDGYQAVIYDYHYITGSYARKDWKTGITKEYPNNIHADALTKHGASVVIVDDNLEEVKREEIQHTDPFDNLFEHDLYPKK
jgi:hypothetical protein